MPNKLKTKKQVRATPVALCVAQCRKEAREAAQAATDGGLDVIIRKYQTRMQHFLRGDSRDLCIIHIDEARAERARRHLPR